MAINLETKTALQNELIQLLQKHLAPQAEIEPLIEKIWPDIEEAVDFAEFAQTLEIAPQSAAVIDPLAHLNDDEREAHLQERIANMDSDTRQMLERTQGKWAND